MSPLPYGFSRQIRDEHFVFDGHYVRSFIRIMFIMGLVLSLLSVQGYSDTGKTKNSTIAKTMNYLTPQSCRDFGGRWLALSRVPEEVMGCSAPTPDAGKQCWEKENCVSECVVQKASKNRAKMGTCFGWHHLTGECVAIFDGKSNDVICFD